jgi:ribosomal protein S18 acetylase RimI-like enzyme
MEFDIDTDTDVDGTVRVATAGDADAVESLWDGYAEALAEHDERYRVGAEGRQRWRRYFETNLVDSSRADVLLAERGGDPAGVVEVRVVGGHPVFAFGRHGQVYGQYVDPAHRGEGVGSTLLSAAEAWFRDRELPFYRYEAFDALDADGFLAAAGMEAVETVYEKQL